MTNRIEKVNSLLEHEISKILLRDFADLASPRFRGEAGEPRPESGRDFPDALITVTHVEATANLIDAKAYISVMPEDKTDKIIQVLNKEVFSVQQKINRMLNMRPIPKIRFVKDEKIAEAAKIEGLLESLKKEEK